MYKNGEWFVNGSGTPIAVFTISGIESDEEVRQVVLFFEKNGLEVMSISNGRVVARGNMNKYEFIDFCEANCFQTKYVTK